jgi:hypothetical protein
MVANMNSSGLASVVMESTELRPPISWEISDAVRKCAIERRTCHIRWPGLGQTLIVAVKP